MPRMTQRYRDISDPLLMALYMALLCNRKGKDGVQLSHQFLCRHFKRKRISRAAATGLIKSMRPILPFGQVIRHTAGGVTVRLGFRKHSKPKTPLPIDDLPPKEEMERELGISTVTLTIERATHQ